MVQFVVLVPFLVLFARTFGIGILLETLKFVRSSVVEAVSVQTGTDGATLKNLEGQLGCVSLVLPHLWYKSVSSISAQLSSCSRVQGCRLLFPWDLKLLDDVGLYIGCVWLNFFSILRQLWLSFSAFGVKRKAAVWVLSSIWTRRMKHMRFLTKRDQSASSITTMQYFS